MRVIEVDSLRVGDRIGRSIFGDNGNLLLGKNVILTDGLLNKLKGHNIYYVYIDDSISRGIDPQGTIDDATMMKSVKTVKSIMDKVFYDKSDKGASGVIPLREYHMVEDTIKGLMKALEENTDTLYIVTELIGTDMYTYRHSVNVAVLAILTFRTLGYKPEVIKSIAMGALLHDIGKVKIQSDLINKPGKLTDEEFEEMKNHSKYGYEMIKEDCVLSSYAKTIIRLHHEKIDGTGYPYGSEDKDIPEFVRAITICDMYDAMTTDRAYRKRMPIYKALEILMAEAVYKIDATIYNKFVTNICIYPPGSGVKLIDGRIGIVTDYRKQFPDRPKIRVINDLNSEEIIEIDLLKELTVFIEDTVDIDTFIGGEH